ncbi:hypothetical protein [Rhizobium sp. AU243]|uniref:hypothetical protein n=1 Tax=Rhizobium sp. AU243 TaxID=2303425 RepID=UPI0010CB4346|nr:hypothetical protein [Rhizobium sp. AU243]TKV74361.1 hypothetical protein D0C28_00145 [Rhizobium sp. AU243]
MKTNTSSTSKGEAAKGRTVVEFDIGRYPYRRNMTMGKHMGTWGTYAENAARIAVLSLSGAMLAATLAACKAPEPIVAPAHMRRPTAEIVGPRPVSDTAVSQKRDTGTYPTFSQPLTAAGTQMGEDEASTMESSLSRLGAARRNGQISEAEYKRRVAELRALAENQKPVATPAASQ